MTSDVVRWSRLFSQQNKPQQFNVMTSYKNLFPSHHNQSNNGTQKSKETRRSSIAGTIGSRLHKTVLLFVWLVINQNVSLVLSDPIIAANNLTIAVKNLSDNEQNYSPIDSLHGQESQNDVDLPSQYFSDNTIEDDRDFTSTWAVHIKGGDEVAECVAREHGFRNLGKVC